MLRINGELKPRDLPALSAAAIESILAEITNEEQRERFNAEKELDFSCTTDGIGRFRVNAALQRGSIALAFRLVKEQIPSLEDLRLPDVCGRLALKPRGLVLVTGPTGCGKSTTLAAMIDHLNSRERRHVVSIEDPIEYIHTNKLMPHLAEGAWTGHVVFRRGALTHTLRQDPDVILVGEMRDLATIAAALTAAETGHLVLTTLHTPSAPQTVDRIIDVFPPHQQQQVRVQLSLVLEAVLCQTLAAAGRWRGKSRGDRDHGRHVRRSKPHPGREDTPVAERHTDRRAVRHADPGPGRWPPSVRAASSPWKTALARCQSPDELRAPVGSEGEPGSLRARARHRLDRQDTMGQRFLGTSKQADYRVYAALAGLVAFAVYLRTLAPTVMWYDMGELTTTSYVLGIAHNTGYPLYILLGKLFTFLPFGDVAYRVNLMSAVFAALTVSLVFLIIHDLTKSMPGGALRLADAGLLLDALVGRYLGGVVLAERLLYRRHHAPAAALAGERASMAVVPGVATVRTEPRATTDSSCCWCRASFSFSGREGIR